MKFRLSTYVIPLKAYSAVLITPPPPHRRWQISWSPLFFPSYHKNQGQFYHLDALGSCKSWGTTQHRQKRSPGNNFCFLTHIPIGWSFTTVLLGRFQPAFCSKQDGFKEYLLEQQQMLWQLNVKIKHLSYWENNLLRNEKWGVFQNITKFITGVDGCKSSDDVVKCDSCLTTINYTLKSSADLLSFIDSKRKVPHREDHKDHNYALLIT